MQAKIDQFYEVQYLHSSSFLACNSRLRSAIRRHHPPQRAVLSQICCFGERIWLPVFTLGVKKNISLYSWPQLWQMLSDFPNSSTVVNKVWWKFTATFLSGIPRVLKSPEKGRKKSGHEKSWIWALVLKKSWKSGDFGHSGPEKSIRTACQLWHCSCEAEESTAGWTEKKSY